MISASIDEFKTLAGAHDIVPVYRELLVDDQTPVSVLAHFADSENVFLLESMEGGETWGRYSMIGVDPQPLLDVDHRDGRVGGLEQLREVYANQRVAPTPGLPRFFGGVVGFLGYEAMCEFERMPKPKPSDEIEACSRFLRADQVIVFDNVQNTCKIVVCARPGDFATVDDCYAAALASIDAIRDTLAQPVAMPQGRAGTPVQFTSNMTREAYEAIVDRTKAYIREGDIIQAVLSQRFSVESDVAPLQLYRALRLLNPSPYTFYVKMGGQTFVGSSPEVMVRVTDGLVELRPIAGTRPRGVDAEDDDRLEAELLADEKERAEHVMLVDLGRNDLGRVSETGSVEVTEYMVIERYSHVMHMVSHVRGQLRPDLDALDVVAATFPAGTLSGAPKIRAMEIIHELEPGPRGVYGGALGYISYGGNMDMAITIRTLEVSGGTVSVQAGAGIVHDSVPAREYEETLHKSRGMQKAVQLAVGGLDLSVLQDAGKGAQS